MARLKYIRQETDIPVPEVLNAYEENGSFFVWIVRVEGVLKELKEEDRLKVLPEIRGHIATLQTLRSNKTGGPSFSVHLIWSLIIATVIRHGSRF